MDLGILELGITSYCHLHPIPTLSQLELARRQRKERVMCMGDAKSNEILYISFNGICRKTIPHWNNNFGTSKAVPYVRADEAACVI